MELAIRLEESFFYQHAATRHRQCRDTSTRRHWSVPDTLVANRQQIAGLIATSDNQLDNHRFHSQDGARPVLNTRWTASSLH